MESDDKGQLKRQETDISGYSEAKTDKGTELHAGQWLDLKQSTTSTSSLSSSKPVISSSPTTSRRMELLIAHQQEVWEVLEKTIQTYIQLLRKDEDITEEISEIQRLQSHMSGILKAMRWEQKGSLDISKLPKEVQDLLK